GSRPSLPDVDGATVARMHAALLAVALVLLPLVARAEDQPPAVGRDARTDVAVTVYNQDLALVKDTREFPLPRGESVLRFEDVAAKIEPRSVAVRSISDPDGLAVIEQNYVFDLISPEKLMEKYVGREVDLIETDQQLRTQSTKAVLLSTNGGPVYRIGERDAGGVPAPPGPPAPPPTPHPPPPP